jgi:hypothetical protein
VRIVSGRTKDGSFLLFVTPHSEESIWQNKRWILFVAELFQLIQNTFDNALIVAPQLVAQYGKNRVGVVSWNDRDFQRFLFCVSSVVRPQEIQEKCCHNPIPATNDDQSGS